MPTEDSWLFQGCLRVTVTCGIYSLCTSVRMRSSGKRAVVGCLGAACQMEMWDRLVTIVIMLHVWLLPKWEGRARAITSNTLSTVHTCFPSQTAQPDGQAKWRVGFCAMGLSLHRRTLSHWCAHHGHMLTRVCASVHGAFLLWTTPIVCECVLNNTTTNSTLS